MKVHKMKQTSIKKNFLMNALLAMSQFIFPLITFPYVSRILGPTGTGSVNFATSLITYFNMFAQLGIPSYGIRVCAQLRDDRDALSAAVRELLFMNAIMAVAAYAALAVALLVVPGLQADRSLYLIISSLIFFNCIGMNWLFQGLEQYSYITISSIIFKFIALLAMFLLVHTKGDYVIYGGISIFASSASNVLNFFYSRKFVSLRPAGKMHLKKHWKAAIVFFAMTAATTVYTNLDTVMLGFMTTKADVGYYNAAVRIKSILVSIVTSLGTVLLPRSSYYVEHGDMDEFHKITGKAVNFVFVIAVPLTVYFMIFASNGIYFLSGDAYQKAIAPMQIIMPTLLLIGITNILGFQVLIPTGREKQVFYSVAAGAVIDFVINAALISSMKSSGASIGTLAAEFVVLLVQLHFLKEERRKIFRSIPYAKIALAAAMGSAASIWVKRVSYAADAGSMIGQFIVLLISAVCFFAVYGGVLLILKVPTAVEIVKTARHSISRIRQNV